MTDRRSSARDLARRDAGQTIYGSKAFESSAFYRHMDGEPTVRGDHPIIARLRNVHFDNPSPPSQGEIAVRAAECVNSPADAGNPDALVRATRDLLYELSTGLTGADDDRVMALLARWVPSLERTPGVPSEAET